MRWSFRRRAIGTACGLALLLSLCPSAPTPAQEAGFRVVIHPDNPTTVMSRDKVADLFLKRTRKWPDGTAVKPVDLPYKSPVRGTFCETVLGRSVAQVRSYWQQRIFSGRGLPPPEEATDAAVLTFVRAERGGVGYVSARTPTGDLRVLRVE